MRLTLKYQNESKQLQEDFGLHHLVPNAQSMQIPGSHFGLFGSSATSPQADKLARIISLFFFDLTE